MDCGPCAAYSGGGAKVINVGDMDGKKWGRTAEDWECFGATCETACQRQVRFQGLKRR